MHKIFMLCCAILALALGTTGAQAKDLSKIPDSELISSEDVATKPLKIQVEGLGFMTVHKLVNQRAPQQPCMLHIQSAADLFKAGKFERGVIVEIYLRAGLVDKGGGRKVAICADGGNDCVAEIEVEALQ